MTCIHPTALVDPGAQLGVDVEIGPYTIVGPHVVLGDRTRIMPQVHLDGWLTLGQECTVFPFASLGSQTQDKKFRGAKTTVTIGDRSVIREYVTINSGTNEGDITAVGTDALIMACCHVAHQCIVGNGVIMANAAMLSGHVIVEDQVTIGGMTGVHQFVRIGKMAMVGGCSKINQDVAPFMMVDGNPSRLIGLNSIGLERRGVSADACKALKGALKCIFHDNLAVRDALTRVRAEWPGVPEVNHLVTFIENSQRGVTR